MHPLRFPNRGIRAKVFVRKIGFKLRVMRLNRVESFYAFLLCFRSEGSPCKGQSSMATASPLAGAADHRQGGRPTAARPPVRGDHPQWQQPRGHERLQPACKGLPPAARPQALAAHDATSRGSRPRPGHRWRLLAARPQGATPRPGLLPARAAANKGSAHARRRYRRGGCPCRRRAAPSPARGQRQRRRRWGQGGARASF
ncbi:hypothetical protein BHM03_00034407 [Ensete ventricosum]|nr:hypothetical protein BHM03_00034407 [Ensete ventricosum]